MGRRLTIAGGFSSPGGYTPTPSEVAFRRTGNATAGELEGSRERGIAGNKFPKSPNSLSRHRRSPGIPIVLTLRRSPATRSSCDRRPAAGANGERHVLLHSLRPRPLALATAAAAGPRAGEGLLQKPYADPRLSIDEVVKTARRPMSAGADAAARRELHGESLRRWGLEKPLPS